MRIFRTFNFIHIVLTVVLFSYSFYYNPVSFNDVPLFIMVLLMPILIIINCASNINLIINYLNKESIGKGRKVFFWIFFLLFTLITLLLIYPLYKTFVSINNIYENDYKMPFSFIVRAIVLLVVVCNGIYIVIYQCYFFFFLKRNSKIQLESLVNEIGESESA